MALFTCLFIVVWPWTKKRVEKWKKSGKVVEKKDMAVETDRWHAESCYFGREECDQTIQHQFGNDKETQTRMYNQGKDKIMKMIRSEEDSRRKDYEKAQRMLKTEKKRQRIMKRKFELEELERKQAESRRRFKIEMDRLYAKRKINWIRTKGELFEDCISLKISANTVNLNFC